MELHMQTKDVNYTASW